MKQLLYIDLFCGAGGTSTGVERARLNVPELKRIMGFGTDYTLVGTQTEQKKFIGNAVECHMSQALCEALANELNR